MPENYDFSNPDTAAAERARMQGDYAIKTDEQGRKYTQVPGQAKNFISPTAYGEAPPEDTSGFFRSSPQWNTEQGKFVTPVDWGKLLTIATGAALTGGALSAAGAFGGAAGGAGGASGALGPSTAANIAATSAAGAAPASLTASGTGAGMSIFGKIAGAVKDFAGPVLGAFGKSRADNRGTAVDIAARDEQLNQGRAGLSLQNDQNAINLGNLSRQQLDDYYRQMVAREQEGRAGRSSAFTDLQRAEYVGGRGPQAPTVTTSGRTLNTMGLGARASTDAEKTGAGAMRQEVMARLQGGNPLPTPGMPTAMTLPSAGKPNIWDETYGTDPELTSPGMMERIANILGPGFTAWGAKRQGKVIE